MEINERQRSVYIINGIVFLVSAVLLLNGWVLIGGTSGLFGLGLLVVQILANVLGGVVLLFTAYQDVGRAMLLSGGLIGLIGFMSCVALVSA